MVASRLKPASPKESKCAQPAKMTKPTKASIKRLCASTAKPRLMPRRGAKTTAIARFHAIQEAEDAADDEVEASSEELKEKESDDLNNEQNGKDTEDRPRFEVNIPAAKDPDAIFKTFKSNIELSAGLCIVRSLGKGRHEIVNLHSVTALDLTTQTMTETLQREQGRLAMFEVKTHDWKNAIFACDQAVAAKSNKLFHFLRLPIEIRYMIYELVLCKDKELKSVPRNTKSEDKSALLCTSKAIYNEANKYWQKNTFLLSESCLTDRDWDVLSRNVRNLHVVLDGTYTADKHIVNALEKFQNLEFIKITYGWRFTSIHNRTRPQRTVQNVPSISRFRQMTGHDVLCALRGVQQIKLFAEFDVPVGIHINRRFDREQLQVYEEFLQEMVSRPKLTKAQIEEMEHARIKQEAELLAKKVAREERRLGKRRPHMKSKNAVKSTGKDDDEYDGTWD